MFSSGKRSAKPVLECPRLARHASTLLRRKLAVARERVQDNHSTAAITRMYATRPPRKLRNLRTRGHGKAGHAQAGNLTAGSRFFADFGQSRDWYHCPRTPQVRWSADAPRCPADPVPVPGRRLAIPGAGRAAGPDPGRGRHRGRAPGRDGRLSVLLPAAGHGSDATPGRPSLAEHAAQRLRLRARLPQAGAAAPWANPDMLRGTAWP